jgi:hypothetical protein
MHFFNTNKSSYIEINESYYLVISARFQIPLDVDRDVVLWRTINLGRQISDISKKSMQATIYCHYN